MKNFIYTFLLVLLFATPAMQAQEAITPYIRVFPQTLASMGLHGPVKSVHYTEWYLSKKDTFKRESAYFFNAKGLITQEIFIDSCMHVHHESTHSYDSLGRFVSTIFSDGSYRREAFYDSLGHFIYSIDTRNGFTEDNFIRYYYDEKGRCIYHEYIPNSDDEKMEYGYDVLRRVYQYDSLDRCILGAELVDGDTSYVETREYDINGNIIKATHYIPSSDELVMTSLYSYNKDNLLEKSQSYYGEELINENVCEYDDQNQMIRLFIYNKNRQPNMREECEYDIHHNRIKTEVYYYNEDAPVTLTYWKQIDYEYYEE